MKSSTKAYMDGLLEAYQGLVERMSISVTESDKGELADETVSITMQGDEEPEFDMRRIEYGMILDLIALLLYLYRRASDKQEDVLFKDVAEFLYIEEESKDHYHELLILFMYNLDDYIESAEVFKRLLSEVDKIFLMVGSNNEPAYFSKAYVQLFISIAMDFLSEKHIHKIETQKALLSYVHSWQDYINARLPEGEEHFKASLYDERSITINPTDTDEDTNSLQESGNDFGEENRYLSDLYQQFKEEFAGKDLKDEDTRIEIKEFLDKNVKIRQYVPIIKKMAQINSTMKICAEEGENIDTIRNLLYRLNLVVCSTLLHTNLMIGEIEYDVYVQTMMDAYDQINEMQLWEYLYQNNRTEMEEYECLLEGERRETFHRDLIKLLSKKRTTKAPKKSQD